MATHIKFFFDYKSPYAYVNWVNLQRLLKEYAGQLTVTYHPINFSSLVKAWGSTPTSEIPPKLAFIFKDVYRISKNRNMAFSVPKKFPFASGLLLCLSSASVGGLDQHKIIEAIWNATWGNPSGEGIDISDENELKKLLLGLDLDAEGLLTYAKSDTIRKEIHEATVEAAQKYGVFGVPTMIVHLPHHPAEEPVLYFGNDQILTIRNILDGGMDYMRSAPEPLLNFVKNIPKKKPVFSDRDPTSQKVGREDEISKIGRAKL